MKEVKAYIRHEVLEAVMRSLHDGGVAHVVVSEVKSFGSGMDPKHSRLSMEAGGPYSTRSKLEFVCGAGDVNRLVALIRKMAHTGEPGDGVIFVSPVERAVKILTEVEDEDAIV